MSEQPSIQTLLEENRLHELAARARELEAQAQALQERVRELEEIRRNLEHVVAVYKRHLFGSRSEKIDPRELEARIAQAARIAREQLAQQKWTEKSPARRAKPQDGFGAARQTDLTPTSPEVLAATDQFREPHTPLRRAAVLPERAHDRQEQL